MKFSCKKDSLANKLNIVNRIILSNPTIPILNNILLQAEKGKLHIKATNLEIGINCWIGAKVDSDGIITVPSSVLTEYINGLPNSTIESELLDNVISFSTPNNTANFNTMPSDDYPTFGGIPDNSKPLITISRENLLQAVNKVSFAVDTDGKNNIYTGIKIEIADGMMNFVATDTLRLSRYSIKTSKKISGSLEFIVPAKAFDEVAHIVSNTEIDEDNDFVQIYLIEDKNQILFRYNEIELVSRLIDGDYPDYKAIIPTYHSTCVTFNREELINNLRLSTVLVKKLKVSRIDMKIDAKNGKVTLNSNNVDLGTNESLLEATVEGEDLTIMFNSRHIIDVLSRVEDKSVIFEFTGNSTPVMFKVKGDDNFFHLMMPITIE